uniref:Little elongation complex subunit 2 C-terminal domain-containing protein n=1 Tax=Cercocebus atys TaxID=9531 RepID=A0A2K5LMY8_CERAT
KKNVNDEVTGFLKFLQNFARKCAQDYNMLSGDVYLFTEKILGACTEQVKKYLEFYTLHEVTSLMVFFPFKVEMELKLEKTLPALGRVKYVKTVFLSMPIKLQLSKDDISTIELPERTAETMHYDIRKDPNAEKLVSRYHPQLALTSQSLFTLLNNHGPMYKQQWEHPVLIQVIPVAGSKPVKVIYINSPLLRNKVTMRERNQIFHEVPLKFMIPRNTSVPVSAVFMHKPEEFISEMDMSRETLENLYLDFDDDVTELETFGVTTTKASKSPIPARASTVPNMTDAPAAPKAVTTLVATSAPDITANSRSLSQILMEQLRKDKQLGFESCGDKVSNSDKSLKQDSDLKTSDEIETSNKNDMTVDMVHADEAAKTEDTILFNCDTNEECLIIDTECKNNSDGETDVVDSNFSQSKFFLRADILLVGLQSHVFLYKTHDPVGEILKMQDNLLEPISRKVPELSLMNLENSKQSSVSQQLSVPSDSSRRLPYELQDYEYLVPQEGSFVYNLFSLQDLLFLMCHSVQRIETRPCSKKNKKNKKKNKKKQKKIRRQFPVYVLSKVDLLHSNSSFYVGHINAFTSKLFLLEYITSEELKEKLSARKISNLFNILQHILKKLSSLQQAEDSSLLIYKVCDGKVTRTANNLYKTHCGLPDISSNPSLLLPYHIHHGRIPFGGTRMPIGSHRIPVSIEAKSSCLPAQQVETEGVFPNKRKIT